MSRYAAYDGTGVEYYSIPNFEFATGEKLDVKVAYRSFNPSASRKVLVSAFDSQNMVENNSKTITDSNLLRWAYQHN
jgi:hypothetical protein